MFKFQRHLAATTLTVLSLSLANAGPGAAAPDSGVTRAEVRADLQQARVTNRMTPAGEIGDTTDVLDAREAFNQLQTDVIQSAFQEQEAQYVMLLLNGYY